MATALQIKVLQSILTNDFNAFNGAAPADRPFNADEYQVWSECIGDSNVRGVPTGKALSAIVSTLVQASLLTSNGECVALTKAGFDLAVESYKRP